MGATVIYGKRLERKEQKLATVRIAFEIIPEEGGYEFPCYSTLKEAVEFAQSKGIDPSHWPIYYGVDVSEIDLSELYDRCDRLENALRSVSGPDMEANKWVRRVAHWLFSKTKFFCHGIAQGAKTIATEGEQKSACGDQNQLSGLSQFSFRSRLRVV